MNNPPPGQQKPSQQYPIDEPPQKRKVHQEEDESVVDEVINEVTDGCSLSFWVLVLRVITFPFRLIWRIIEGIFD